MFTDISTNTSTCELRCMWYDNGTTFLLTLVPHLTEKKRSLRTLPYINKNIQNYLHETCQQTGHDESLTLLSIKCTYTDPVRLHANPLLKLSSTACLTLADAIAVNDEALGESVVVARIVAQRIVKWGLETLRNSLRTREQRTAGRRRTKSVFSVRLFVHFEILVVLGQPFWFTGFNCFWKNLALTPGLRPPRVRAITCLKIAKNMWYLWFESTSGTIWHEKYERPLDESAA